MAKIGGGLAYTRDVAPREKISQSLQYWGGLESKARAEELLAEEREEVRVSADLKENREKYGVNPADFKISEAGYGDLNDINRDFSSFVIDKEGDLAIQQQEAYASGDYKLAREYQIKMAKNKNSFQNKMATDEAFSEVYTNYMADAKAGKTSGWNTGFDNFFKAAFIQANGKVITDDNGELIYMTEYVDDDGKKHTQVVAGQEARNNKFTYYKKNDLQALSKNTMETIGTIKRQRQDGSYFTLETQLWDDGVKGNKGEHSKALRLAIEAQAGDVGFLSDMTHQFNLYDEFNAIEDTPFIDRTNTRQGRKFSKEEKGIIEDKLFDYMRANYDEESLRKPNSALVALNKPSKEERSEETIEVQVIVNPKTNKQQVVTIPLAGVPIGQEAMVNSQVRMYTTRKPGGEYPIGIMENDKDSEILSIGEGSDGNFYAEVRTTKRGITGEGTFMAKEGKDRESKTAVTQLSSTELANLIKGMNLDTAIDLRRYLKAVDQEFSTRNQGSGNNASQFNKK